MNYCVADDCEKAATATTKLCWTHYKRLRSHGDFVTVKKVGAKTKREGGDYWVTQFRKNNGDKLVGTCPGCQEVKPLTFDHNHGCCAQGCMSCFRDWICGNCNALLGHAKDRIETLSNLIAYLKVHSTIDGGQ